MRTVFITVFLFSSPCLFHAQDARRGKDQEIIESIVEHAADEQDVQSLGEELEYLRSHPIDLLRPGYDDLLKLPFVSPLLAESVILFCDTVAVVDIEQIRSVPLMTDAIFEKILPFVTAGNRKTEPSSAVAFPSAVESRSRVERRLQTTKGFAENRFLGGPANTYQRIRISNSRLELAGLFEKDAGEVYHDGMIGGYIAFSDSEFLQDLVLGNYKVSSAQGLVFAANNTSSKGNDAVGQIMKRGSVISPSVSTDEFRYFQGAASKIRLNDISITGLYSIRKLPATLDSNAIATSFYSSGIYRTTADLKRRNTLGERTLGGKLDYAFDGDRTISLTLMNVRYDHYLERSLLDLAGERSITAGSLSWEIPVPGMVAFGEAATNDASRFSKIFGFLFPVSRSFALSYHHRSLTSGYTSPFARPFGERSNIAEGETGNYLGLEIKNENVQCSAFLDYFSLPSTANEFASAGREAFAQMTFPVSRTFSFVVQIRNKERSQISIRQRDDERIQTNYRFSCTYKATRHFSLSHRIEAVHLKYLPSQYSEKGLLMFIEGKYKHGGNGVRIASRMIYFDTRSYDSRIYQYESDVAGNYSNPPLYGKGVRWYIVAGYEVFDDFLLSCKYSETKKMNEVVLGSGVDEIRGNRDDRLALQLDFQF